MLSVLVSILLAASIGHSSVIRRQDPGMQQIPTTAKADNTFNNGAPQLVSEPPQVSDTPPAVYGARSVDLPFGRLYHGNMMFFSAGELNTPTGDSDQWINSPATPTQNGIDSANQSACGIPDNAFSGSKVAIHPYFLKYADLSRYCMQDVCISFWKEDGSSDMMLKVTDICSTNTNDPTSCATPADIKIDRGKAGAMEGLPSPPTGDSYPEQIWWFFMKCWDDGLAQPAYQGNNWFTDPPMTNNLAWAQSSQTQQTQNNQIAYAANGWPTYPNGAYNPQRDNTTSPPITDWAPGDPTPAWSPIAGGKGWGQPDSLGSGSSPALASSIPLAGSPTLANGAIPPPSVTPSGLASSIPLSASPTLANGAIPPPSVTPIGAATLVSGGQEAGQGSPSATASIVSLIYSNGTAATVPGSAQVGTNEYDEQDECDEL